jgi:hypothetical protein
MRTAGIEPPFTKLRLDARLKWGRAEVKVNGSQVKVFMPSSKVTVELDRESDDVLADK